MGTIIAATPTGSSVSARFMPLWIGLGSVAVGVKCVLVMIAIEHWRVPVHPLWVIGPTLFLAAFATLLYVRHSDE